jgi:hypothetical protein
VRTRNDLQKADDAAKKLLARGTRVTTEELEDLLLDIKHWPTQSRPNVAPDAKPVTGMCLGAVYVLGGVGMSASAISQHFPNLTKAVVNWCSNEIPDKSFPFSSVQVNFNYAARKHVDGNNIGPSYIASIGHHTGGELWVADTYLQCKDEDAQAKDGIQRLKGGGGPALLACNGGRWTLFNGNAEHETRPFAASRPDKPKSRISFIVFSHSSYAPSPPSFCSFLYPFPSFLPAFLISFLPSLPSFFSFPVLLSFLSSFLPSF